jgi:hypothetical protein
VDTTAQSTHKISVLGTIGGYNYSRVNLLIW